jgi:luciferase family oxidoreductase group 1
MGKTTTDYSILDLALISQGSSLKSTLNRALRLAQKAERFGYKRYWLAEHHNAKSIGSSATSILIGYIAEGTETIRVGSGGIMLPNHSPLIVAEQFGTLGALYPNRIDLGLGRAPGTDRETAEAIRPDFMSAAYSFPTEIEKLKQYFAKNNEMAKVRAPVAEGVDVPFYILGSSTDSAHLAASKGLPYAFASHFATEKLFDALAIYRNEFIPTKENPSPYTIAGVNIIIAETQEEAERLSTSLINMIIGIFTGKRDYVQAPTEMTHALKEIMLHPRVQAFLKYAFIGTKETVKKQVKSFIEQTKVDELIAVSNMFNPDDREKSYEAFAEIMKELNEERILV